MAAGGGQEMDLDTDSLVLDVCARCGRSGCEVTCIKCKMEFHRACASKNSVWTSREVICGECAASAGTGNTDSLNKTIHKMTPATRKLGGFFTGSGDQDKSSDSVPMHEFEDLKKRYEELERAFRRQTLGPPQFQGWQPDRTTNTTGARPKARSTEYQEREWHNDSHRSGQSDRANESWREQAARYNATFGPSTVISLTKEQREMRKSIDTKLPPFCGEARQWVDFISRYVETTDSCGFSASENRERLSKSLYGDALRLVEQKLQYARNVDEIMSRLEQKYGQPAVLTAGMGALVRNMDPLDKDLTNLALFLSDVEAVEDVFKITRRSSKDSDLLYEIERKLPFTFGREWQLEKRAVEGTISDLIKYLNGLFDAGIVQGLEMTKKPSKRSPPAAIVKEKTPINHRVAVVQSASKCPMQCTESHPLNHCKNFEQLDSRQKWNVVKKHNRCKVCLGPHFKRDCPSGTLECGVGNCHGQHHRMLHFTDQKRIVRPPTARVEEVAGEIVSVHRPMTITRQASDETIFRVVPVVLVNGDVTTKTFAFLDSGSSVTLVSTTLARKLGLSGKKQKMALQWTDTNTTHIVDSEQVVLDIGRGSGHDYWRIQAQTLDNLDLPSSTVRKELLQEEELQALVEPVTNAKPEIIVGLDNAVVSRTIQSVVGKNNRIVASETPLGWLVEGSTRRSAPFRVLLLIAGHQIHDELETLVERYIEADNYGLVADKDVICESDENLKAREIMSQETVFKNGRFETGLLWKSNQPRLPDNREMALQRFNSLEKKLDKNPDMRERLDELIRSYVSKAYIRVSVKEGATGRNWYLPVFTVVNPTKPGKVRMVWDAAAQFEGVSLNSALMTGPDLTSPLVDILLRFRTGRYAVTGDIQEMFHQIGVKEDDRSALKFLWRDRPTGEMIVYEMCVLIFGANCSPTLAQFAKNLNAERFKNKYPRAVDSIVRNHYVDDYLESNDSEEELKVIALEVRDVHAQGGFHLHKIESNSSSILTAMNSKEQRGSREVGEFSTCSVLGMVWETGSDTFSFRLRRHKLTEGLLEGTSTPTKRMALSTVMSIYDPLGLLTFRTLEVKLILREAWRANITWDQPLPFELTARWNKWGCRAAAELENIVIPRWLGTTKEKMELHTFCDASENAIAAVVYAVQRSTGARRMVFSKCRVAPLKTKTIPRLELDGCVLGTKAVNIVRRAVGAENVDRVVMWTDARDVLYWIQSTDRRYTIYVANRVSTILSSTSITDWRWVSTQLNPADMATKDSPIGKESGLWWRGPDFLDLDESNWPIPVGPPEEILEVRRVGVIQEASTSDIVPEVSRISKWLVLIRTTARVKQAVDVFCRRRKGTEDLTPEEESWGEGEVIKMIQKNFNPEKLRKFAPFKGDDGIWRARGRTVKGEIAVEQKFPIILEDHPATRMLIHHYHHFGGHHNYFRTLNEIRQRFVLARLRSLANKVVKNCQVCKVMNAKPIVPEMGALPKCRLAIGYPPFSFVGVDVFGPMEVTKFRRKEKRWGMLFTCMTTRAIYIELIVSLNTQSCLAAIESFVTRRNRWPVKFYSDNGTNFVGAVNSYRGPNGERLRWQFNPPGCAHMGGAWERLIGAAKRALQRVDFSVITQEEDLRRSLLRAERIVNSRPLTEYSVDEETQQCLTPQMILDGSRGPPADGLSMTFEPKDAFADKKNVIQDFWNRYTYEYLPALQLRSKWTSKTEPLKVGDSVYLCDSNYREGWKRAIIKEIWRDAESEQVRQVVARTADGKDYHRAASKVALIKID